MGRALVRIAPDLLARIFCEGTEFQVIANGLPVDARVVGVSSSAYDPAYDLIYLVIESKEIQGVKSGDALPIMPDVKFKSVASLKIWNSAEAPN